MANISFRMDDDMRKNAEALFEELGIDLITAYIMFTKTCLRNRRLPYEMISADPFYSSKNVHVLDKSIKQVQDGKVVVKSLEELREMETKCATGLVYQVSDDGVEVIQCLVHYDDK